jgi:hypothetical protein
MSFIRNQGEEKQLGYWMKNPKKSTGIREPRPRM